MITAPFAAPVAVALPDVLVLARAAEVFGITTRAIEGKISRKVWVEGREFHRAPDGTIWVDVRGVQKWATNGRRGA